jgi:cell division septal protein FtsQ
MVDQEAQAQPIPAPPLRGRSIDHLADRGSSVRPSWRLRAWRWLASGRGVAAGGLLAVAGALVWGTHDARFNIHTVTVAGNRLVDATTVAKLAAVRDQPIWSIDPAEVAARLRAHPYITGASVSFSLPDQVQIEVREPRHALTWQSGAQRYSIAADGRLAPLAASVAISETAIIHDWRGVPLADGARVAPAVVALAQTLIVRLPAEAGLTVAALGWDPARGLVTQTSDGSALIWGDPDALDRQLQVVLALKRQQIAYRVLDLRGQIAAYRTEDDPTLPLTTSATTTTPRER